MKTSIVTAALIFYFMAPSAWAQTRAKLHVVYPAISGINAPLWYATEQNLFQKYGLEVELIYIPTALQVTRVVLTGDSQIAFSGGAPVVNAVLERRGPGLHRRRGQRAGLLHDGSAGDQKRRRT